MWKHGYTFMGIEPMRFNDLIGIKKYFLTLTLAQCGTRLVGAVYQLEIDTVDPTSTDTTSRRPGSTGVHTTGYR